MNAKARLARSGSEGIRKFVAVALAALGISCGGVSATNRGAAGLVAEHYATFRPLVAALRDATDLRFAVEMEVEDLLVTLYPDWRSMWSYAIDSPATANTIHRAEFEVGDPCRCEAHSAPP